MHNLSAAKLLLILVLALPGAVRIFAQDNRQDKAAQTSTAREPSAVFRVNTGMVLLDVIVTGTDGKPVTSLKEDDFTLKEKGKKQKIASFRLENSARPAAKNAETPSGPYIYSNKPEAQGTTGAPTILLIDGLNTTTSNQQYARKELLKYAATQLQPGQLVAVYALGDTLRKLQDFTSDSELLRAAIESYRSSQPQLQSSSTVTPLSKFGLPKAADSPDPGLLERLMESIQAFEEARAAPNMETRIRVTLASFRALARIAAQYPGRKNLVWVSAGFPFTLSPEDGQITEASDRSGEPGPPPLPNAASLEVYNADLERTFIPELRSTAAELSQLQVAVYPVDARGLLNVAVEDASQTGLTPLGQLETDSIFGRHVRNSNRNLISTQTNMRELARQTGGKAFVNRNDIDRAVALASRDGGSYYEIGYYPDDKDFHGEYRSVKLEVAGGRYNLRYRPGYFAVAPERRGTMLKAETAEEIRDPAMESAVVQFSAQAPPPGADGIAHIRFLVDSRTVTAQKREGGGRRLDMDFFAYALGADGQVKASSGKTVDMDLTEEQYASASRQGLLLPLDVQLPSGELRLRLAVRDNATGYYGTLTVPMHVPGPEAAK